MILRTSEKMAEIEELLKGIAAKKVKSDEDDFNVFDYSGGNYDDAYSIGVESGEVWLARKLIEKYFKGAS